MKKTLLFLFIILIVGCTIKDETIPAGIILDLGDLNYDKFEVISFEGEGVCAGTEAEPCEAIVNFKVNSKVTANPMQLFSIDGPIKQIKGYNQDITFEPGHDYTLKYYVLKINPTDQIYWEFAGKG